ncbi:MAG TPA: quinol:cytochrome C oxidoreductase, partial [Chitinophagaceae bacterium]|nr:quinol:cytochrome C oxidoreductase [Chitinophagaceae bacterium]
MKKLSIIAVLAAGAVIVSCSDVKRKPGSIYMPDMAYSRAYETYADHSNLKEQGINYTNMPVAGTIARGEE